MFASNMRFSTLETIYLYMPYMEADDGVGAIIKSHNTGNKNIQ